MPLSHLPIHQTNAELELEELLGDAVAGVPESQTHALSVCRAYRIAAMADFFMSGRPERLRAGLSRSAAHYLGFVREAVPRLTSVVGPLYDALAADELDVAREIAANLGSTLIAAEEYEEDFLHAMLLTRLLAGVPVEYDEAALLARFRALCVERRDVRVDLWSGLLTSDGDSFEAALEGALAQYRQDRSREAARGSLAPDEEDTMAKLNIEGLAFIRLGRLRGFALDSDYLLAPSLAQMPAAR